MKALQPISVKSNSKTARLSLESKLASVKTIEKTFIPLTRSKHQMSPFYMPAYNIHILVSQTYTVIIRGTLKGHNIGNNVFSDKDN